VGFVGGSVASYLRVLLEVPSPPIVGDGMTTCAEKRQKGERWAAGSAKQICRDVFAAHLSPFLHARHRRRHPVRRRRTGTARKLRDARAAEHPHKVVCNEKGRSHVATPLKF